MLEVDESLSHHVPYKVKTKNIVSLVQLSISKGGTLDLRFIISAYITDLMYWYSQVSEQVTLVHNVLHARISS